MTSKQRFRRFFFFFPFQLVLLQVKKNHLLVIFWLLLYGFVSGNLANNYGVPHLFFAPEYKEVVDFWSFFIIGVSLGIFIMTYNIASYTANASHFPFIATLNRPFLKYSGNNLIFPTAFVLLYIYKIISYYAEENEIISITAAEYISGLLLGIFSFLVFNYVYFFSTNKNLFSLFNVSKETRKKTIRDINKASVNRKWWQLQAPIELQDEWTVETYFSGPLEIRLARESEHYPPVLIYKVFNQNHLNATRFQIVVFVTLIVLGLFRENVNFQIPAGSSLLLLFTMFLILTSVLKSWLRGWSTVVLVLIILAANQYSKYHEINYINFAYGMDYWEKKAEFKESVLKDLRDNQENYKKDFEKNIKALNKWRLKNSVNAIKTKKKPKLVIVNTSGGGLRSSLWTFYALSRSDSILNGELLKHTQLITGSSGGMLGAAYLRELQLQKFKNPDLNIYDSRYVENIGKDILNPVAFTIAINDLFVRFQDFKDGVYHYNKDRGYIFEQRFNNNCENIFTNRRLSDYISPVRKGIIPEMIFAPVITNDGKRLLIASENISYLTNNIPAQNIRNNPVVESIEFRRFFHEQNADNVLLTSVMRMNATFPYILPNVTLPSEPSFEVMDAGLRDNYGMITTLKYIYTFRNWISTNTSGVVIIEVRDKFKEQKSQDKSKVSKLNSLLTPLGSVYGNITSIQTYNQDDLLQYASLWFDGEIDIVPFQLKNDIDEKISLSWHLTLKEKKQIYKALEMEENQESINKLRKLFE